MDYVRPKKHLGQHFLKHPSIAQRIAESLTGHGGYTQVLEIGPGTGILTQFLIPHPQYQTRVVEIDRESVGYLLKELKLPADRIIEGDFLQLPADQYFTGDFAVIGNFPYHISSQIFFKVLDHRDRIPEVVGMVQKEVGERLAAKPGNKDNGILSILLQAFYDVEYLFTVEPDAFIPPPKVRSGVVRARRNQRAQLPCNEKLFKTVVKQGFNTRRKMLRNALKPLSLPAASADWAILDKRAEQLSVEDFIELTLMIEGHR